MVNKKELLKLVLRSLHRQGFHYSKGHLLPPESQDKNTIRSMHAQAVAHKVSKSTGSFRNKEDKLLAEFAEGREVEPFRVYPKLVEIQPGSDDELLFRYAKLHWSIPVSAGYGRRLRFLVKDENNGKLIGLFGLADPVISLPGRDAWVGWTSEQREQRLMHVMDAFVLGSVPPYSFLLGGKLTAMMVSSNEVRNAFKRKYAGHQTMIRKRDFDGRLALVTTTSALGKSAIYDRIRFEQRLLYEGVGFTEGWGEFHFSDGVYGELLKYANRYCDPTRRNLEWGGEAFRNKREVVMKVLPKLGLPREWLFHGVRREIFVVPLAKNARQFLRGEHARLCWYDQTADDLFRFYRMRWLIPRSERDLRWRTWDPECWRLFGTES